MKKLLLLTMVFYIQNMLYAQQMAFSSSTTIYMVRHAEKEAGNDPVLTTAGKARAGDLFRFLHDKKIARIYVTNFRRSGMTGDSLRLQAGIDTVHYLADTTGEGLLAAIKNNNDFAKPILVIGHTNTVPRLVKMLMQGRYEAKDIADDVFDDMFIITFPGNKGRVQQIKYGAASGNSGGMNADH